MPEYFLDVVHVNGRRIQMTKQTENIKQLKNELRKNNLSILKVKKMSVLKRFTAKKITKKQIADFTQQMALLCQSNLELIQALTLLIQESKHPTLKKILCTVKQDVENGLPFSKALGQFPKIFDAVYCSLIQAGEKSGTLPNMLKQLAEHQENMLTLRAKITKALYYPTAIITLSVLITVGLLIFVVPQFETIFKQFDATLPIATQVILNLSHQLRVQFKLIVVSTAALILIYKVFMSPQKDRILLHLPGIKSLLMLSLMARWSRILATLLSASIPLLEALNMTTHAIPNPHYQHSLKQVADKINKGDEFSKALRHSAYFSERVLQMISVGEQSGQLTLLLYKIAQMQQNTLDQTIELLSQWLEPCIMLIIAILIGGLMIALYLPVFKMGSVM